VAAVDSCFLCFFFSQFLSTTQLSHVSAGVLRGGFVLFCVVFSLVPLPPLFSSFLFGCVYHLWLLQEVKHVFFSFGFLPSH
jgi:hypothetical protein